MPFILKSNNEGEAMCRKLFLCISIILLSSGLHAMNDDLYSWEEDDSWVLLNKKQLPSVVRSSTQTSITEDTVILPNLQESYDSTTIKNALDSIKKGVNSSPSQKTALPVIELEEEELFPDFTGFFVYVLKEAFCLKTYNILADDKDEKKD